MKKILYNLFSVLIVTLAFMLNGCSEDATPSIYEVVNPPDPIPVGRLFDFNDKAIPPEIPYAVTVDAQGNVYVSLDKLGIKQVVGDSLAIFSLNASNAAFFKSITMAPDSSIYGVRGVKGIYKMVKNSPPATFVTSSNGVADNLNDIVYDYTRNIFWSCGADGYIYMVKLDKSIKKYQLTGNAGSVYYGNNNLFVALRDTNNQELIWKFPIVSEDSLGTGEIFFNFTEKVDSVSKITDITADQDGNLYICSNKQSIAINIVYPDKSFSEFYSGLIVGSIYSFVWGPDNNAYFTNVLVDKNTDVWKIDMKKNSSQ